MFMPAGLEGFGACLEVTGPSEALLPAALRTGVPLLVEHLKQIHKELQHPLPSEGTGKNKGVVRADRIKALVEYVFSSEPAEEQARIMARLGAAQPDADDDPHIPATRERHPHELADALRGLDLREQPEFKYLEQLIEEEVGRQGELNFRAASEKEDAHQRKNFTPTLFRKLLPDHPGYGLTRSPDIKRYYAYVPCAVLRTQAACSHCNHQVTSVCNNCVLLYRGKVEGFLLSHNVTWEGPRRKLTELEALSEVVYDYIWPVFNLHVGGHGQTEPLGVYERLCSVRHV